MKRLLVILCAAFAFLLAVPTESHAGFFSRIVNRLRPQGCSSCGQQPTLAPPLVTPKFRRECGPNGCRLVPVK